MKDKPESPSAFPWDEWTNSMNPMDINPIRHSGMTLRDYFAAKALQAYLSMSETSSCIRAGRFSHRDIADTCYEWADLMLAARKEGE